MLQISGIDTSSRLIGWTSGTGETVPECGAWELDYAADDLGVMLEQLYGYLCHHWNTFRPDAVIIEAPIHVPHRDNLMKMRKLYSAHAFVEWFFTNKGVEVSDEDHERIKSRVTGNHLATKDDMVFVARKCGLILPKVGYKDAADSWGAWLLGVDHYARAFQPYWDQLIYGRRNQLL